MTPQNFASRVFLKIRPHFRLIFGISLATLAGYSFSFSGLWPGLMILFPIAWLMMTRRRDGFMVAMSYYGTVTRDTYTSLAGSTPGMSFRFYFESWAVIMGLVLIASVLWGVLTPVGKKKAWVWIPVFALLTFGVPQIGAMDFMGLADPLYSSGILFPGLGEFGILGIILILLSVLLFEQGKKKRAAFVMLPVFLLVLGARVTPVQNGGENIGMIGTNVASERITPADVFRNFGKAFSGFQGGALIEALPENSLGMGGYDVMNRLLVFTNTVMTKTGRLMLAGAPVKRGNGERNGFVVLGLDPGGPVWRGADSIVPTMKIARYIDGGDYRKEVVSWHNMTLIVSMCYEEGLFGLEIKKLIEARKRGGRMVMISLSSNHGFKKSLEREQENSATLFGRMFGIPVYRSVND